MSATQYLPVICSSASNWASISISTSRPWRESRTLQSTKICRIENLQKKFYVRDINNFATFSIIKSEIGSYLLLKSFLTNAKWKLIKCWIKLKAYCFIILQKFCWPAHLLFKRNCFSVKFNHFSFKLYIVYLLY